ncbi:MAG: alpha-ribazole phosphatase family protein [Porphyromonas sp.]|nr:alpha-ribazole phosphatase family protein [Porphyromonas sp.]
MDIHVKQLWVTRHTAVDVAPGICYGATDVGLKPTFAQEAEAVRQKLIDFRPDIVLSSPLSRALRLAHAVGYPDVKTDDRLREQSFGDWEMQRYDDIDDPQMARWYKDYVNEAPTNGESFARVVERVGQFIEECRTSEYQNILVFAHGGVQMAVGAYLGLYPMIEAPQHYAGYGSVLKYQL